jgi:PAS domain S-box-containing protein
MPTPASEPTFQTLVEHARDAVFIVDRTWHLTYVNLAAVSGLGFGTSDELLARQPLDLIHPPDRQAAAASIGPALRGAAGTSPPFQARVVRRNGGVFVAEIVCLGVTFDGAPAVAMMARDLTELLAAREDVKKATRVKSDFLTTMSHELRTPLNAVLGFAQILSSQTYGELNPAQRGCVKDILESARHMISLVNDLLDLRRAQSSRPNLVAAEVALLPIVEQAMNLMRPLIEDSGHVVTTLIPGELPKVRADSRALLQILLNLVGNAVKYTPVAGAITVRAVHEGPVLRVEIEDNGPGIAPENHGKVFEYFSQLGAKKAYGMKGSGLGLALTKQLVEGMDGTISLRSALGEGSTFGFTLPCASPIAPPAGETRS